MTRDLVGGRSDGQWDGRVLAARRVRVLAAAVLLIDWVATGAAQDLASRRTLAIAGAVTVILIVNAIEKRPTIRAWPYLAVLIDVLWALSVCLVPDKLESAPWIVLAVPILTAIVNFGLPAGLVTWGATAIGYLGGLIALAPATDDLSAFPLQMSVGVRQTALLLLVAIPAGYLTEQLAVEVHLQTLATNLARRRGRLLKQVAEHGTELATIDADVLDLLCESVASLGFDAVDVIQRTDLAWRVRASVGPPLPLPFAGDEAAPECRAVLDVAHVEPPPPGEHGRGDTVIVALASGARSPMVVRAGIPAGATTDADRVDAMLLLARQAHVAILNGGLVEELRGLRDDLQYEATHDALTGLSNRAALMAALRDAEGSADWDLGEIALLLLDLDGFKSVNDRRGHGVGDQLLKVVTERLSTGVGAAGHVARLGGDEFTVLLRGEAASSAETIADGLVEALVQPFRLGGEVERIGTSIGLARSEPDVDPAELLRRSDVAMYQAKQAGRRCVRRYSPDLDRGGLRRLELRMDLLPSIEEGRIGVVYQPLRRLSDHRIVGVEALLRWEHPIHGLVPAQEVVEIAGVLQQAAALTTAVLERTAVEMAHLVGAGGPLQFVAINVATDDITASWLPSCVRAATEVARIPPGALVLELNEGLSGTAAVSEAMQELRALGARLVIDDWGRRATTLTQIGLPVDGLKIDRSLLSDLDGEVGHRLLSAVVAAARSRGLTVVAEGIETAEDLDRARALGCQLAQGYFVGAPMSAMDCEHLFERERA